MPLFRRQKSPAKQLRLAGKQLAETRTELLGLIFCIAGYRFAESLVESRRWEDEPSDPLHQWYAAAIRPEVAYRSVRICTYGIAAAHAQVIGRSVRDLADLMPAEHAMEHELSEMPDDPEFGDMFRSVRLAFDGLLDAAGVTHDEYSNLPLIMSYVHGSRTYLCLANEFAETVAMAMPLDTAMDGLRHQIFARPSV